MTEKCKLARLGKISNLRLGVYKYLICARNSPESILKCPVRGGNKAILYMYINVTFANGVLNLKYCYINAIC